MEILLVNNQLQLGGAETVVHQLRSRLKKARLLVAETPFHTAEVMYPRLLSRLRRTRFHNLVEATFPMFEWTNRRFVKLRN